MHNHAAFKVHPVHRSALELIKEAVDLAFILCGFTAFAAGIAAMFMVMGWI
jgi:hypothetical protein